MWNFKMLRTFFYSPLSLVPPRPPPPAPRPPPPRPPFSFVSRLLLVNSSHLNIVFVPNEIHHRFQQAHGVISCLLLNLKFKPFQLVQNNVKGKVKDRQPVPVRISRSRNEKFLWNLTSLVVALSSNFWIFCNDSFITLLHSWIVSRRTRFWPSINAAAQAPCI